MPPLFRHREYGPWVLFLILLSPLVLRPLGLPWSADTTMLWVTVLLLVNLSLWRRRW